MTISVVIPCHNAGRWICDTLRSVAAQTLAPHEIIVVDDASEDDSVDQISRSGVEVRLFRVQYRNAAATRNAGIKVATGDWIALLDADDMWDPIHLERAAKVLHGTADVAYRAICDELTDDDGRHAVTVPQPITQTRTGITHQEYLAFENQGLYFGHSSCIILRARLREIGGYDPKQVRRHDIDMWLRLIHDHTWSWDAMPTVVYRDDTPGSISRAYAECEYYYLKALIRNKEKYPYPAMDLILEKISRKVMTIGFTDGTPEQYHRFRELAWPYLTAKTRAAYSFAQMFPWFARKAIRAKRTLFTWRTGKKLPDMTPSISSK